MNKERFKSFVEYWAKQSKDEEHLYDLTKNSNFDQDYDKDFVAGIKMDPEAYKLATEMHDAKCRWLEAKCKFTALLKSRTEK